MDNIGQYIVSVTTTAIAGGILCSIVEDGGGKAIVKMLYGLILALALLSPLAHMEDTLPLSDITDKYTQEAAAIIYEGTQMAAVEKEKIIKQNLEAYIVEKAKSYNVDLTADITLKNALPEAAVLQGKAAPIIKWRISEILEKDLGITRENQLWT